jgi:hypothetical protein
MTIWIAFALGLFLGTFLGMLAIGLCVVAREKWGSGDDGSIG